MRLRRSILLRTLIARIRGVPGRRFSRSCVGLPLSGINNRFDFTIVGRPPATIAEVPAAQNRWVTPGYLQTMRIPITRDAISMIHDCIWIAKGGAPQTFGFFCDFPGGLKGGHFFGGQKGGPPKKGFLFGGGVPGIWGDLRFLEMNPFVDHPI